jgi:excinuclease ABC subunit A
MKIDHINISKAKVHNLKEINVKIPKNSLTVITGPSGSGKSSLAFDTIYVEGQRRYIESLSSYARQFLGQYQPPDVESITGLSPSIAIDQKSTSNNPRSTVGTITEVYDYMRVLWARVGTLFDPKTGKEIKKYTPQQIVRKIVKYPEKTKIQILSPLSGNIKKELVKLQGLGFARIFINGDIISLEDAKNLKNPSEASVVIDRILIKKGIENRLTDSIELALKMSSGIVQIFIDNELELFSENNMGSDGTIYPDLEPRLFSFNSPLGACPSCNGLGQSNSFDKSLMIIDKEKSILDGAIGPIAKKNSFLYRMVQGVAKAEKVDLKKPYQDLPKKFHKILFEGAHKIYKYEFSGENSNFEFSKEFPGITKWLEKKYLETSSDLKRAELEKYMTNKTCLECNGHRLNTIALSTHINKKNIVEITKLSIDDCATFFQKLKFSGQKGIIAEKVLKEINSRLSFLKDVGLNYLNLNRAAMTLSGGEAQRIRLATQIGSALSGVLYVLDEPSIGLHQRDNQKLIGTMKNLRDLGNTVIVVEHDEETIREADYIIDMGPGAGVHGGEIVYDGEGKKITSSRKSITAKYISKKLNIEVPERRKLKDGIHITGARENNLQDINVAIPLDGLICITGVSGSGKSSLIHEVLVPALKSNLRKSYQAGYERDNYKKIDGLDKIDSVIELDQSPIGRTPKSNPATYTSVFDSIRKLFSNLPESKVRGYKQGRFSFNVKGGRCEECEGNGVKKIEMHFLPDVYITCTDCLGKRYNKDTLSILFKGLSIADVLDLTVEEAIDVFKNQKKIHHILSTLNNVGLGYISLGQSATTLSGGEAQRLKLAKELAKMTRGHCLYILDEPTTGLHFQDIKVLLSAINDLIDQGNTVLVIEHNLDVIKVADHIIDLGPEGGDHGGLVVAEGTPEEICKNKKSYTAKYLKDYLK